MTIEINDVRGSKKGVLWNDLQTGVVYIDCVGRYTMATDESSVVDLSDGFIYNSVNYDQEYDEFTPTKCKLEVFE